MKAAILRDFNNLCIEEVPQPKASEPGTVVVQIKSCGICATDYKAIKGIRKNVTFPFIPGHETSGIIVEIGPNVIHFKVGDEVICQPTGYCGFCKYCRSGNPHYCENAFTTGGDGPKDVWPGAFAEYMLTKEQCLFKKPKNISFNAAALTEPLSGAWKGVIQYSEMKIGDDVVIIGVGGIGLLCLMVAKAAGAGRLIAVDISNFGRKNAIKLGATHAIDPSDGKAKRQIYEIIPDGPDIVVEAAGSIDAVKQMISILRRGTHWNLFGITTHETFELDGGMTHFLEARMDASFGTTPLAMEHAIKLMETGLINTEHIISHCFTLDKIHEAIEVMENQGHNKIIINP
ncbi:MAG: alcohol dehydrogenase catalytic domain-containing protein [Bacteroidales bacterium]